MTAPAPQQEYIITDEQLKKYEGLFFLDEDSQEDFKIIRSRPVQSLIPNDEQCPHWLIWRFAGIDGDTNEYFCNKCRICSQSERDKVLKILEKWVHDDWIGAFIRPYGKDEIIEVVEKDRILAKIASLRSSSGSREP